MPSSAKVPIPRIAQSSGYLAQLPRATYSRIARRQPRYLRSRIAQSSGYLSLRVPIPGLLVVRVPIPGLLVVRVPRPKGTSFLGLLVVRVPNKGTYSRIARRQGT